VGTVPTVMTRIIEAGNIKNYVGEIASASPRKTNYQIELC